MFETPSLQSSNSVLQINQSREFGFWMLIPARAHRRNLQRSTAVSALPPAPGMPASIPNDRSLNTISENSLWVENTTSWAIAVLALPAPSKVSRDILEYQAP